jgi:hypothetical protein
MGAAGVRRVRDRYSWDVVAQGTMRIYATVIERRAAAAANERRYAL